MSIIENKYHKWYHNIVINASNRNKFVGSERHHIIPKSMGGSNDKTNLVYLTAREHLVCHMLLTKFTTGNDKRLMHYALGKFIQMSPLQDRRVTSWEYAKIRDSIIMARTGHKHSDEAKRKMSDAQKGKIPHNKGQRGVDKRSDEFKENLSKLYSGKSLAERHGEELAKEIKEKISSSKIGHKSGMTGKSHSEETKQKMRERQQARGKTGPQKRIDECPYCLIKIVTVRHIKFCKSK